jgi:hypothetical protein
MWSRRRCTRSSPAGNRERRFIGSERLILGRLKPIQRAIEWTNGMFECFCFGRCAVDHTKMSKTGRLVPPPTRCR